MANQKRIKNKNKSNAALIPYGHQRIDAKDIKNVVRTLKSNWLTQGPAVPRFEAALANYCGVRYAVAVSSGTAALHLAYLAVGLKNGNEVITTPNSFAATANMLLAVGAKPVFCDIRSDTYNIDESKIEKLITPQTKAIVTVDFAGHPCEIGKIKKIAAKHKLILIEDACHALGADYKNKKIGGLADMTIFSFHPVKSITTAEGGAILTNNRTFYERLTSLRSHGIKKDKQGFNVMNELGYNYRLTDMQAALGISQLKKLDNFIKMRHNLVRAYQKNLSGLKEIILPKESKNIRSSWHIYTIRVRDSKIRNKLMDYLKRNNIGVNFHYPAIYSHPYYRQLGFKEKLPSEEEYQDSCITLPLYVGLKHSDIRYVCDKIKNFFHYE